MWHCAGDCCSLGGKEREKALRERRDASGSTSAWPECSLHGQRHLQQSDTVRLHRNSPATTQVIPGFTNPSFL